mgnify:CR=1 FL=1
MVICSKIFDQNLDLYKTTTQNLHANVHGPTVDFFCFFKTDFWGD